MEYPWTTKANKVFRGVLIGQFILSLIIAFFTDTWLIGFIIGGLTIALPLGRMQVMPHAAITRHVVGVAVQLMAALHIQQTMGLTEIHFEIFVMLAFLSFYRDWRVILSSVSFVAIHHILFFITQSQGMPTYILEQNHVYFYLLVIHALFALTEAGLLMVVAKGSFTEAQAAHALSSSVKQILAADGHFKLNVELNQTNKDLREFNDLISSFSGFIGQAKGVSGDVMHLSHDVAELTNSVNDSSDENAMQIDLIATATEEMTAANAEVATLANNVNDLISNAFERSGEAKGIILASSGDITQLKTELSETANGIGELADKCDKIEEVMSAIKAISDQTNLLALNAAIESARAGDHGRGFAVVADEVRQLALRTRENAEQISDITASLISDASRSVDQMTNCLTKVDTAVNSSEQACDVIDNVVEDIENVTENVASVAAAAEEQSSVSSSISQSTQELSTSVEKLKGFANQAGENFAQLHQQIDLLNNELGRFEA